MSLPYLDLMVAKYRPDAILREGRMWSVVLLLLGILLSQPNNVEALEYKILFSNVEKKWTG